MNHELRSQLDLLAPEVALVNPARDTLAQLGRQGFSSIRSFTALPHAGQARWLFPQRPLPALRAWQVYTPFHPRTRLYKHAAQALSICGMAACLGDRVILARRGPSPFEALLDHISGGRQASLAIGLGTGPRPKQVVQCMSSRGQVYAYAKFAAQPQAQALVCQEARMLAHMQRLALHSVVTPQLLYSAHHAQGYLIITTPLAGQADTTALELSERHFTVLGEVARHRGPASTGPRLAELGQRSARLGSTLDAGWQARLAKTAATLAGLPSLQQLPTVLSHGDFTPWNLRVIPEHRTQNAERRMQMALLDWERGRVDQLPLWDAFHFCTLVGLLVKRLHPAALLQSALETVLRSPLVSLHQLSTPQVYGLYTAYLFDTSLEWFEALQGQSDYQPSDRHHQEARAALLDMMREKLCEL